MTDFEIKYQLRPKPGAGREVKEYCMRIPPVSLGETTRYALDDSDRIFFEEVLILVGNTDER